VAAAAPAAPAAVAFEGLPPVDGVQPTSAAKGARALYGPFNIRAQNSNRCLDIAGGPGAVTNGDIAQQWGCLGYYQTNQKWYLTGYTAPDGRTITQFNAMHSGKCLDVLGGPGAINNGTQVVQWECLGTAQTNQQWYLTTP
jgi:hypothetical protein